MFWCAVVRTGDEQPKLEEMVNFMPGSVDDSDAWFGRRSKDRTVNKVGKSLLNMCFMLDCIIVNGFCDSDVDGEFTYVSPHGSSVIDYFIISEDLCSGHSELRVRNRVDSWYLPVEIKLIKVGRTADKLTQEEISEECIVWSEACLPSYIHEFASDDFNHCIRNAHLELRHDVDAFMDIFLKALYGAAACMVRAVGKKRENANDWFDEECTRKKRTVKTLFKKNSKIKERKH